MNKKIKMKSPDGKIIEIPITEINLWESRGYVRNRNSAYTEQEEYAWEQSGLGK